MVYRILFILLYCLLNAGNELDAFDCFQMLSFPSFYNLLSPRKKIKYDLTSGIPDAVGIIIFIYLSVFAVATEGHA